MIGSVETTGSAKPLDACGSLYDELVSLRRTLLAAEQRSVDALARTPPEHRVSARNLTHYVELRRHDLRDLQARLAEEGLSSLGRNEAHSLATLEAVLDVLERASDSTPTTREAPIGLAGSRRLLDERTTALLGAPPAGRATRVMVTAPSEAAEDPELLAQLLAAGMDCLRINCAHDDPDAWAAMISNLRQAKKQTGHGCRVQMDIAGPKLRTGELPPGPPVVKLRPQRDELGRVLSPARAWLTPAEAPAPAPEPRATTLPVPGDWLAGLPQAGDVVLCDARDRRRVFTLDRVREGGRFATTERTAYVLEGSRLWPAQYPHRETRVGPLPRRPGAVRLHVGQTLRLTRPGAAVGNVGGDASVPCTLADVFDAARPGEPIWFDDGRIGGTVEAVSPEAILVRVTHAPSSGASLRSDKGINLPATALDIPAITAADARAIPFVARHADVLGLSFVNTPEDVWHARRLLSANGGERVGLVLKVETQRGFQALPQLLLAALEDRAPSGVMIARGDLAVECGYQRLAEVQEEILWLAEAAHLPVIWATQVLETLAKKGQPSRAEITDAAMGGRAECVMLNKGPSIVEAVRVLADILGRMADHQDKKRSLLRRLRSFEGQP